MLLINGDAGSTLLPKDIACIKAGERSTICFRSIDAFCVFIHRRPVLTRLGGKRSHWWHISDNCHAYVTSSSDGFLMEFVEPLPWKVPVGFGAVE